MTRMGTGVVCLQAVRRLFGPARLVCVTVFLLPLICWPGSGSAFAAPKMRLLVVLDLALAAAWVVVRPKQKANRAADWLAIGWVAAVSLSTLGGLILTFNAVLLALLPLPVFWCSGRGLAPAESVSRALWLATTCEAVIVVLQFCGIDPLRAFGWQPEIFPSLRMRAYGTLGNPDFVAAWCCAAVPLCWSQIASGKCGRLALAVRWAAAALQIAAILATGSRVFALAIPLQALLIVCRPAPLKRLWPLALPAAAVVLYFAPARPLAATVQGRLYMARVTASHWRTPLTGYGPGSFESRFAVWQSESLRSHTQDPVAARFAGAVDHAHNDYLEFLVEYGPVGFGVFMALAVWISVSVWRARAQPVGNVDAAASIGAATLLVLALVDFPFHRPAEWSLLWLYCGILARSFPNKQGA